MSYLSRIDHAFSDGPCSPTFRRTGGMSSLVTATAASVLLMNNFLKNQHLYFAALNYYYQHSFCYIELGDGDELWENRSFSAIQNIHSNVFWLLSLFYEEHRLFMLFGNHDIAKKDFHPFSDCCFHEGLRLKYCVTGQELYLTHGHQADFFNSTLWRLSCFLVRYLWKPLEQFGVLDPTSAAKKL